MKDAATAAAQTSLWLNLVGNDTDPDGNPLSVIALGLSGTKGQVTLSASNHTGVTYSTGTAFNYLSAGETATDKFTYTVSDGHGGTSVATVTMTVTGVNQAPTAVNVTGATTGTAGIWINLSGLDSDVNAHDTLTVTGFGTTGTLGTPKFNPTGAPANGFGYSPGTAFAYLSAGETATDRFTYTISDGHGGTSTATAIITITGVNTAPTATVDRQATDASHAVSLNVLANDTDVNLHDLLSVVSLNMAGAQGSAAINADGTVTYTPGGTLAYLAAGKTATDTFSYTISDGHGGTSTAQVQMTVTGTWKPPAAVADNATTDAQHATTLNVLANDSDPQSGVTLAVASIVTTGIKGAVKLNANNTLTYTPGAAFASLSAGETATETFSYTVSDGHGATSTATVAVTVTGVNQAPTAVNVTGATTAGAGIWINLAGLDSDPNAHDVLTVTGFGTAGTKGTPKFNPTGVPVNGFGYSPGTAFAYLSAGETATDSFTYTISDGHGGTSTATAVITVTGVNSAPVAVSNSAATDAVHPTTITVLANDSDPNLHDTLTVASVNTSGTKGSVAVNADGTLTYNPGAAFTYLGAGETATDRFAYTVSDGHGGTSTATVTVTVTGLNDAPTAPAVTTTTAAGSGVWVNLSGFDSDPDAHDTLNVVAFGAAGTIGTPKFNPTGAPANGFGYSPGTAFAYLSAGETATDSFTYTISDGHGGTSTGVATIIVNGVNTPPVAAIDRTSTDASHTVTLDVLSNDTDANRDDVLRVTSVDTSGAQGRALINANGTITYMPGGALTYLAARQTATDTFSYTVSDGHGGVSTAPVQVTVSGTWQAPVATADTAVTDTATPVTINVLGNDTDPQSGVALSVLSVNTTGTDGNVTINQDGTITYTPGAAFAGLVAGTATTDSFFYTVSDGHGSTSTATVAVTVKTPGATAAAPQAVYVSVNGNDAWSGLLAQPNGAGTDGPKATLQAAELVMRTSPTIKTAYIESGDYYVSSPLYLGPADVGESWLAYPGATAVIHGGVQVTGWTQGANGVWTAQAPAGAFAAGSVITDLFYSGMRETLSRYPNDAPDDPTGGTWLFAAPSLPGENTSTSFQFNAGDIPSFNSTNGLYVNVYSQNGWQNYVLPVASIDYATHTITLAGSASLPIDQGSRYFLFNASSQLDATDEWYYDGATNTISFKAPAGFDGSGVTLGTASNIFSVYNTSNITIAGLTLTGSLDTGSAINVANSTGVTVAGNTINNVGVGVSFSNNSSFDTVEANRISTTGGNGVQLPGGTHDINVVGNYIHDIGQTRTASGVWLSGSSNDLISHNLIQNVSKNGVSVGASPTGVGSYNDTITYNEIANANLASSDGGGIYVNGQYQQDLTGDLVAYNNVYGTSAEGTVSSAGIVSSGLLPATQLNSYGIYLDDYASGISVIGNLVHDNVGGIDVHSGWSNTISGNFLVNNSGAALQNQAANALGAGKQPPAANVFSGNVISAGSGSAMAAVNLGTAANAQWIGNVYDAATLSGRMFASLDSGAYLSSTLQNWEALGYDARATVGAVTFVDAGTGNFTLAAGSAALSAGIGDLPLAQMGLSGFLSSTSYAVDRGGVS